MVNVVCSKVRDNSLDKVPCWPGRSQFTFVSGIEITATPYFWQVSKSCIKEKFESYKAKPLGFWRKIQNVEVASILSKE